MSRTPHHAIHTVYSTTRSPHYAVHIMQSTGYMTDETDDGMTPPTPNATPPLSSLPSVKLTCVIKSREVAIAQLQRGRRGMHCVSSTIHPDSWDRILCAGVPVSLREIVSLVCSQLRLRDCTASRMKLLQCSWTLGWHVTARDSDGVATHFWGGGVTPDTTTSLQRGDWVEVKGTEVCRGVVTSRLARIICGVRIRNLQQFFPTTNIPDDLWENENNRKSDTTVFLLVRYAMAHPDVGRQRGPEHRPLCPGPLRDTHCLWKWYQRPANFRRGCWRPRPWSRHKHMFGKSEEMQNFRKNQDARAWFDVIQTGNIVLSNQRKKSLGQT